MVALARAWRAFHVAQQRVHFLQAQAAAGAHRMVAGKGRQHMVEAFLQRQGHAMLAYCIDNIAHQPRHIAVFQQGRHFAHADRAGAETLDGQAEGLQRRGRLQQQRGLARIHVDDAGDQQPLALDAACQALAFKLFIDQSLMGGVLVDDDHAPGGLGQNIGFVHLRPCRAKRMRRLGFAFRLETARGGFGKAVQGRGGGRGAPVPVLRQRAMSLAGSLCHQPGHIGGPGRRGPVQRPRQRRFQRPDNQPAHQAGIAKPHFGFCRMHIDIDSARIAGQIQHQRRVPVAGQIIHISAAHRAMQQLVAHRTAIDEQILRLRIGAVQRRQAGIAGQRKALARRIDHQRVFGKIRAEHLLQPGQQALRAIGAGGPVEARQPLAAKAKPHILVRHRQPPHDIHHRLALGPVGFEEFQPRRGGGEQVAHVYPRAAVQAGRGNGALDAAIDADGKALRRPLGA